MSSLAPKYGPAPQATPLGEAAARARLEIYVQTSRMAHAARDGVPSALAQRLGDAALQMLFSVRAGQALVRAPLANPVPPCASGGRAQM
jgi:hypothetical protein